jgi:hypothetical protein
MNFGSCEFGELGAQFLDIGALLADQNAGARGVDRNAAFLMRPFDDDLRNAGLAALLEDEIPNAEVLMQQLAIFVLIGVPAAVPGAVDAEPQPDRVNLLSQPR